MPEKSKLKKELINIMCQQYLDHLECWGNISIGMMFEEVLESLEENLTREYGDLTVQEFFNKVNSEE